MRNRLLAKGNDFLDDFKFRRSWKKIAAMLSCFVVAGTIATLTLPGITLTGPVCGLDEHTHTTECYLAQDGKVPVCTTEELYTHTHSELCYGGENVLLCKLMEIRVHTHSDECYVTEETVTDPGHKHGDDCYRWTVGENLICTEEETEGHSHIETCFADENVLLCTLEEAEGHTHDETCHTLTKELTCILAEAEAHVHGENCSDEEGNLICTLEETEGHSHVDSCYTDTDKLTCGKEEAEAHTHTDRCYTTEKKTVCELEEKPAHAHTEQCREKVKGELICTEEEREKVTEQSEPKLVCESAELALHTHTESCYTEGELTCVLPEVKEHIHTEECLVDRNTVLVCELKEHIHTDECKDEETLIIEELNAGIALLPSFDEIEENMMEETDRDKMFAYYLTLEEQFYPLYEKFLALPEDKQELVEGKELLMGIANLFMINPLKVFDGPLNILAVNPTNTGNAQGVWSFIVSGTAKTPTMWSNLNYFKIITVSKQGDKFVVTDIDDDYPENKAGRSAPDGGFLIVYHRYIFDGDIGDTDTANANIGDIVTLTPGTGQNADWWKSAKAYNNSQVYGSVSFAKDLTVLETADTKSFITLNLYNYGNSINRLYNSNKKYPGFQQDNGSGAEITGLGAGAFNFGNNITTDLNAGLGSVTVRGGNTINAVNDDNGKTNINRPLYLKDYKENDPTTYFSGVISNRLGADGYPALADGTSLKYLFSESAADTISQANKNADGTVTNINGLFQYDPETGSYNFNSRENHAQFNAATDTFTLYKDRITSNYMMYPFGNFLPFNDINTQTQVSSEIDSSYLETIQTRTGNARLRTGLEDFRALMTAKKNNWKSIDAVNRYFAASKPAGGNAIEFTEDTLKLDDLYTIDYDVATDFYFGMEMQMKLMQPHNGLTGPNGDQKMYFYFTGDDDVWVYIDGYLTLDLSGIHRHVGGAIDFERGVVMYFDMVPEKGDVGTAYGEHWKLVEFEKIFPAESLVKTGAIRANGSEAMTFKDYSQHDFKFYYMERGAGSSVCRLNFNFPMIQEHTIDVIKQLEADETGADILGDTDYKFQILQADGTTKTEELFFEAGKEYTIKDPDTMAVLGTGTVGENGIFTLKAGQLAEFDTPENGGSYYVRELLDEEFKQQYGANIEIGVDITEIDYNSFTQVVIDQQNYAGVESNIKDISENSTVFTFNNIAKTNELAKLAITKDLVKYTPAARLVEKFKFDVKLNGMPLEEGTEYAVYNSADIDNLDTAAPIRTDKVEVDKDTNNLVTASYITLSDDETAVLDNILIGSEYSVSETTLSSYGYDVKYTVDGQEKETGTGKITEYGQLVKVLATNTEEGTYIDIPLDKVLTGYETMAESTEKTFTFKLEQLANVTGTGAVTDMGTRSVTFTKDGAVWKDGLDYFKLVYLEKDIPALPQTYYYRVTELAGTDETVKQDTNHYIVAVKVEKDAGRLKASFDIFDKYDGATKVTADGVREEKAVFTNRLITTLKLSKTLRGIDSPNREFEFHVTIKDGDNLLTGEYSAVKTNADTTTADTTVSFAGDNTATPRIPEGTAVIRLKHTESIEIKDLPAGAKVTVVEQNVEGFEIKYELITVGGKTALSDTGTLTDYTLLYDGNNIDIINTTGFELPQTGGWGTAKYIMGGMAMMIVSAFTLVYRKIFRKKGVDL